MTEKLKIEEEFQTCKNLKREYQRDLDICEGHLRNNQRKPSYQGNNENLILIQKELEAEKEAKSKLELEVKRLKDQLEESQNDERELQTRLTAEERQNNVLLTSLSQALSSCQSGNSDFIITKEELKQCHEELEDERKSKNTIQTQFRRVENDKNQIQIQYQDCLKDKGRSEDELEEIKKQNLSLKSQLNQCNRGQGQMSSLKRDIEECQSNLTNEKRAKNNLEDELEDVEDVNNNLRRQNQDCLTQKRKSEEEKQSFQKEIQDLKTRCSSPSDTSIGNQKGFNL